MLELVQYRKTVFFPKLWTSCDNNVEPKEAMKYVPEMTKIMMDNAGIGLAANQVGLDIPLFIMYLGGKVQPIYQPRLLECSEETNVCEEGCLSIPEAIVSVKRPNWVRAEFVLDETGIPQRARFHGLIARCFMHEWEHLQGVTIIDHASPEQKIKELKCNYFSVNEEMPKEIVEGYVCVTKKNNQ